MAFVVTGAVVAGGAAIGSAAVGAATAYGGVLMGSAGLGWATAAGAGLGAGIGQLAGGNTESTLMGAGIGAGAGFGLGSMGAASAGTGVAEGGTLATAGSVGVTPPASAVASTGIGATGGSGMSTLGTAMMMGQAGLGIAQAFGSTGSAFQDKIELSAKGKDLKEASFDNAQAYFDKAQKGEVEDAAFMQVGGAKRVEGTRNTQAQGGIAQMQGRDTSKKGVAPAGGGDVKAIMGNAGARMTGLFSPTSTLNSVRKEELLNSINSMHNIMNIDNQTAAFNYSSQLSQWGAAQDASRQKGAALGGVASMIGSTALTQSYINARKA